MSLHDIYVVSNQRELVAERDVLALEQTLGFPLPKNYHSFLTTLGVGLYCEFVGIVHPTEIMADYRQPGEPWASVRLSAHAVLSRTELRASVAIASTTNGDQILFCPAYPDRLFVLPRHDSEVYWIPEGFSDLMHWVSPTEVALESPAVRYFVPWCDRHQRSFGTDQEPVALSDLVHRVTEQWTDPIAHILRQDEEEISAITLFVPTIGGMIDFTHEQHDDDLVVSVWVNYDSNGEAAVERLAKVLERQGFYAGQCR